MGIVILSMLFNLEGLDPVNWLNHIRLVSVVTATDRPKSVHNH